MIDKRFCLCIAVTVFLAGCAHNDDQLPEIVQVKKVTPYHRVSDGDTVGSVSRKYGMKQADLIKLNNLEQPYQLYDGQRLLISPKMDENLPVDSDVSVKDKSREAQETDKQVTSEVSNSENVAGEEIPDESVKPEQPQDVQMHEYIWPISNGKNKISQHFDGSEGGVIIEASSGTPVRSIADGVVVIAGIPNGEAAAYGITVVVKHVEKKTMSIYSNLKEASVSVHQKIKQGTKIGSVGQSGTIAEKPQLYFEINDLSGKGRRAIDPEKLLAEVEG